MRLIARWVPGDLPAAVAVVNERNWINDVQQFVPGVKMIPYVVGGDLPREMPQSGHYIILRVSDSRAKIIEGT